MYIYLILVVELSRVRQKYLNKGYFIMKSHSGVSFFYWSTVGNGCVLSLEDDTQIIFVYFHVLLGAVGMTK